MEWQISDAEQEQLPQLEKLEQECFSLPWTREQLESQLPDHQHCFLTACQDGRVLGYVGMMHVLDEGYISNVAVSARARRRGVGDSLIKELLSRADSLGLRFVTLEVRESNTAAISLYEKHGFCRVGLRKKYYDLPKEDAILMTIYLK